MPYQKAVEVLLMEDLDKGFFEKIREFCFFFDVIEPSIKLVHDKSLII